MTIKYNHKPILFVYCTLLIMVFFSCNRKQEAVPFPKDRTEFIKPSVAPLQFSEPKKIEWRVNDTTNFQPTISRKVAIENLPSKPFYPDGFFPLKAPINEITFQFNQDQDTLINFEELSSSPINFSTSILEVPLKVRASLPKIQKNATVGIFEFGEDQGLPGYFVSAMMEDKDGMMWIATDKGLCRFDGEYLEVYDFIDPIFTGAQASVNDIIEDKKGRIWVYTAENGIYVLDLKAGLVSNASVFTQGFNFNTDCTMLMDSRGMIWLGTLQSGVYVIDPNQDTFRHTSRLRPGDNGNTMHLTEDQAGNIWIGSVSGLSVLDVNTGKIQTIENQNEHSLASVSGLFRDSENRVWVGTQDEGVSIIDASREKIQYLGTQQGMTSIINHFTEGNDKRIWMSSNTGVYIFDSSKENLKFLNASKGLSDDLVNTMYLDHHGQMWIATSSAINLMDTAGLMPNFLSSQDGVSGPDAWSFLEDDRGQLWIGTRQGFDIYDPEKNSIKTVEYGLQLNKANNISYYFQHLPSGDYLIVAPGFGLAILNSEQEEITAITVANGLNNYFPSSSIVDRKGRIWTGTFRNGQVELIDLKSNTFKVLTNRDGLIGNIIWGFAEDELGQIWVGTDLGINIINEEENTISYLMEDGKISERNTGAFFKDKEQRLWMGSRSGLLIADQKNGVLTKFLPENGLVDPAVYTIYENKGKIYIGTGNGLTVFMPNTNKASTDPMDFDLKSYGKEQGFIYTDFNADAAFAFKDKLWWGNESQVLTLTNTAEQDTSRSVTYISGRSISDKFQNFYDKKALMQNYPQLDTLFSARKDTFYLASQIPEETGWLVENNIKWDSLKGNFNLPENLRIPFEHNYLSFQFTGTQLSNRDKTRYSYMLEGFDNNWSDISDKPFSENYRNLPAGNYTFKVRSRTFDGIWSTPAEFSFTILPHWTNTWWAWVLYVIAFFTIVGAIVQYRSRMLKKENLILEEKVKHRTEQLNKSIEDLKGTQSQLIQSEKMASLGELTAGIAHEIQNPLNFVNNFSEVNSELIEEMKEELEKGNFDEVKAIAKDIDDNEQKIMFHGKRADAIVKGMLQHSRSSDGKKEPTDINALADEYLRLAYHGLRAKDKTFNATLKTDFDDSIGKVNIAAQDIGRVILNLITNAFYVVDEKKKSGLENYEPTVSVSTKKGDKKLEIKVTDNGNGIPQKILDKIFQPFFTTKPSGKGTGLGLSLSYDIVKAHGGELKVETRENEGTEFLIQLPI